MSVLFLVLLLAFSVHAPAEAQDGNFDKVIELGVKPGQMKYDMEEFSVPAGGHIKLMFDNSNGTLQHNVLILVPGDQDMAMQVAQKAWSMQNPIQNDYVPDSDKILFHTALLSPCEKETITFQAPGSPGDHPYLCSFPGHAPSMTGVMHVRDSDDGGGQEDDKQAPDEVGLGNLTYRYYHGKWKKLPSFDDLEPVDSGSLKNGKVSLNPGKRNDHYGLVFEGKLKIPADGDYQFYIASDDGSRLSINGEQVAINDGTHPVTVKSGVKQLSAGVHDLRLEYFEAQGNVGLQMALITPEESLVYLSEDTGAISNPLKFRINPTSRPDVFRVRMPDSSPRSVAVGLPSGTHYCFDASDGTLQYAWTGKFLNVGPERGDGKGRGGKPVEVLGERFDLGLSEYGPALRFGSPDRKPEFSFRGYIRHGNAPPTLMYQIDDLQVRQQVRALDGKRGVELHYKLSKRPSQKLFFRINRDVVKVSASQGKWINESTLALPGKKQFKIRVINPE